MVPPIPKALTPANRRRPVGPGQGSVDPDTRNGPSPKAILGLVVAKADGWRNLAPPHGDQRRHQPGHTSCGVEMPDSPLDRTKNHAVRLDSGEDAVQRSHLDHVANRRCSTVCLDESDFRWANPGIVECLSDGAAACPSMVGGGESGLVPAVIGDAKAEDNPEDAVAVGFSIVKAFQHEKAGAGTGRQAVGGSVEGPADAGR